MATITINGKTTHTIGELPKVGTKAPDFTVTKTDLGEVHLQNYLGKIIVLNIFPSLDTSTCATVMLRFNEIAAKMPNILILCISADLPFAQNRFCKSSHVNNVQPASIFRHPNFGHDYGILIKEGALAGLLARAVIIINEKGDVVYTELVKEIADEPNYSAILTALNHVAESA